MIFSGATKPVLLRFSEGSNANFASFKEVYVKSQDIPAIFGEAPFDYFPGESAQLTHSAFPVNTTYGKIPAGTVVPTYNDPTARWTLPATLYLNYMQHDAYQPGTHENLDLQEALSKGRYFEYGPTIPTEIPGNIPFGGAENFNFFTEDFPIDLTRDINTAPVKIVHMVGKSVITENSQFAKAVDGVWDLTQYGKPGWFGAHCDAFAENAFLFTWDGAEIGEDHLLSVGTAGLTIIQYVNDFEYQPPPGNQRFSVGIGLAGHGAVYDEGFSGNYQTVRAMMPSTSCTAFSQVIQPPLVEEVPGIIPILTGLALLIGLPLLFMADNTSVVAARKRLRKR
jgi:hypothetical protein